jgi:hypothetical protein
VENLQSEASVSNSSSHRFELAKTHSTSFLGVPLMPQPLFDVDLTRVSQVHYITGKAAINFPHPASTTGGWHFLSYFDRESGVAKVSLAGIHYPDTTDYFSDLDITDVTAQLATDYPSIHKMLLGR